MQNQNILDRQSQNLLRRERRLQRQIDAKGDHLRRMAHNRVHLLRGSRPSSPANRPESPIRRPPSAPPPKTPDSPASFGRFPRGGSAPPNREKCPNRKAAPCAQRSRLAAANASTTTTAAGWMARHTAPSSSAVSTPVCPSTPGESAATGRRACTHSASSWSIPIRWRVAKMRLVQSGPKASGVIPSFPSPATSTSPSLGSHFDNVFASADASSSTVWLGSLKSAGSSVRYCPTGFPMALAASSVSMVMRVANSVPIASSSQRTPGGSGMLRSIRSSANRYAASCAHFS